MKLISRILSRFNPKAPYNVRAAAVILLVTILMLLGKFMLNKEDRANIALESGQRLEILLETGEMIGKNSKSEKTDIKSAADEKIAPEELITENSPSVDKPQEPAQEDNKIQAEKDPQLSTIEADSSGSKLPEEVNSVSIKDISAKPVVVIIIKELGLSSHSTLEALELPKEITMGFSPYAPSLEEWIKKSNALGHESILNIPMETKDYNINNSGSYALLTQSSDEKNLTRLKMLLGLIQGYSAVYSDDREIFTKSANSLKPVLELLMQENKYFIYGAGHENYSVVQVPDDINYPILVNDLVLDGDISSNAINDKFIELEKIANEKGYVVAMAHPYPITISILKDWLAKTTEKGLVVSPASLLLGKIFK